MTTNRGAGETAEGSKRSGQALAYITFEPMELFHLRKVGVVEMKSEWITL